MSEIVRLYSYKRLLAGRRALPAAELRAKLEISAATLKRDIAKLRDQLHVPIRFDRDRAGYVMDGGHTDANELPSLWFMPEEILALVTIEQLLAQLAPGMLGPKLKPLQDRLAQLMERHGATQQDVAPRIRLVHAGKRTLKPQHFEGVATATMARKRLHGKHFNRQNGETTERALSPQRLVHYRDNWYVDAWCHLRAGLRSFSVDALSQVKVVDESAREVPDQQLDDALGAGYGIFGGANIEVAVLRFAPNQSCTLGPAGAIAPESARA